MLTSPGHTAMPPEHAAYIEKLKAAEAAAYK